MVPTLPSNELPIACMTSPGDIVYVPGGWFHATIGLGRWNAYMSTFTGDDGGGTCAATGAQ